VAKAPRVPGGPGEALPARRGGQHLVRPERRHSRRIRRRSHHHLPPHNQARRTRHRTIHDEPPGETAPQEPAAEARPTRRRLTRWPPAPRTDTNRQLRALPPQLPSVTFTVALSLNNQGTAPSGNMQAVRRVLARRTGWSCFSWRGEMIPATGAYPLFNSRSPQFEAWAIACQNHPFGVGGLAHSGRSSEPRRLGLDVSHRLRWLAAEGDSEASARAGGEGSRSPHHRLSVGDRRFELGRTGPVGGERASGSAH
jgi:hypothetical protein